jgi:hypothetical protein
MKRHVSLFLLLVLLGVLLAGHPHPQAVSKWAGGPAIRLLVEWDGRLPVPPWVTTP